MRAIVTTSWDDGHRLDMRVAEMLAYYKVPGTFYISPKNREISEDERLPAPLVRELSQHFEIGAHTMTHPHLTTVPIAEAREEIAESKKYLEEVVGSSVQSFCYPAGYYNDDIQALVRDAGFKVARTVVQGSRFFTDPLAMPTTVHAYNHWWHYFMPWDDLAIEAFEKVAKEGGIFHLWGHSWEIEKNGHWSKLARVLKHIGSRSDVLYMTNAELV